MAEPGALALREFLASFRMPLFFFVSGYFAYRATEKWTVTKIKSILGKKVKAQIIGTSVFAGIYAICFHHDIIQYFSHIGQGQYWFTITLFQMFLIYLLLSRLEAKLPARLAMLPLLATSVICIGIFIKFCTFSMQQLPIFPNLAWGKLCLYFPYFALGLYARKENALFQKLLSSTGFTFAIITGFILTTLFVTPRMPQSLPGYAICYLPGCFGILAMTALFYRLRHFFASNNPLARALTFTGQRSLDIYFIHYYFLPDIAFIPLWFYGTNPIVPMLLVALSAAIPVICISLGVSAVIRTSPSLASWLFAAKTPHTPSLPTAGKDRQVILDNRPRKLTDDTLLTLRAAKKEKTFNNKS